jgi:hypothetical protein
MVVPVAYGTAQRIASHDGLSRTPTETVAEMLKWLLIVLGIPFGIFLVVLGAHGSAEEEGSPSARGPVAGTGRIAARPDRLARPASQS